MKPRVIRLGRAAADLLQLDMLMSDYMHSWDALAIARLPDDTVRVTVEWPQSLYRIADDLEHLARDCDLFSLRGAAFRTVKRLRRDAQRWENQ